MFNINSISFRIPLFTITLTALLAGGVGYLTVEKLAAVYGAVEPEGAKSAVEAVAPSVSRKAVEKDCEGIKGTLDAFVRENPRVIAAGVRLTGLALQCSYTAGEPDGGAQRSLPVTDADGVKIGEVSVTYSLDAMYRMTADEFYTLLGFAFGVYFILLLIVMQLLVSRLKPLHAITGAMERFNPEAPEDADFYKAGNDEVARLARSAGKMFDTLVGYANRIHSSNTSAVHSESHLKEAQRMAKIGSWEYHVDTDRFLMSTEMYRILHMNTKNENVRWGQFLAFIADEDKEFVRQVIDDAVAQGSKFHMGYRLQKVNGDVIEVHTYGKVRKKADGTVRITGVTRDVTEQNRTQQMIENLAYYDALTKLPNRSLFKDRLSKAVEAAKRSHGKVAVLFLDLDHFKLINDTLGHHVGDRLLVYVAETLAHQLRGSDTVSRIGGDEFVVLLPQVKTPEDAEHVAEKLLKALEGQHVVERHTLFVSTSIGIALYPEHAEELPELLKHADTAMYEAKQKGRNNWQVYHPDMGEQRYGQMLLEEELFEAVAGKERFEILYQPLVTSDNRKTYAFESLLRWDHPEHGLLEPDQFLPMMESNGMIIETGYWMLDAVAAGISERNKEGKKAYPVFINLSARQLQDESLVERIAAAIEAYGIEPGLLGFEIAEGILISNVEAYSSLLQRLHNMGVLLSVDNYGTSDSSIPVLGRFPIELLKVSEQLTAELTEEVSQVRNVSAILAMAKALGFRTVLEGIEDEAQYEALKEVQCDLLQGFLYSRPLTREALETYLEEEGA